MFKEKKNESNLLNLQPGNNSIFKIILCFSAKILKKKLISLMSGLQNC